MLAVELTYSLDLDISSFDNIDLFRRGYYRLYFNVKTPSQGSVSLQCCTKRNKAAGKDDWCRVVNEGCTAISAPVLVQYTRQHCAVDSHFTGTITQVAPVKQVCGGKCQWPQIEASLDLYFAPLRREESAYTIPAIASYDKIDSRPLQLCLCGTAHQLHAARYVLFRCKNHSGAKFQLHVALTRTTPVLVEKTKEKAPLFAWLASSSSDELPSSASISTMSVVSLTLLRQLCTLLLESQVGLVDKCQDLVASSSLTAERQSIGLRVEELLRGCGKEVRSPQALDHLNTASAVALSMWDVFSLVLVQEQGAEERLLCDFHKQQVNRFRHLHFLVKLPMSELLSSSPGDSKLTYSSACEVVTALGRTNYSSAMFSQPTPILCTETDGTEASAPVIMEQRFVRQAPTSTTRKGFSRGMLRSPVLLPHLKTKAAAAVMTTPTRGSRSQSMCACDPEPYFVHRGILERRVTYGGLQHSPPPSAALSTDANHVDGLFHRRNNPRASRGTVQSARQSIGSVQERLRPHLPKKWTFLSEANKLTVPQPYFTCMHKPASAEVHLVVCVHGLEGRSEDLSALRNFLQVALPDQPLMFLMAHCIEERTFSSFQSMGEWLCEEIVTFIQAAEITCSHMSFIGHSLGNIAIRAALAIPAIQKYYHMFHTFLSLAGPHLGTVYSGSLVGAGMWFLQKYTKSVSLLELSMRDDPDPRKTLLYELSLKPGLALFKNVLLVSSHQDQYVPFHSARIEVSPLATHDEMGSAQQEMVHNILFPLLTNSCQTELRIYNIVHQFQTTDVDVLVGRAGHVALLDSELCLEMLVQTCLYRFFQT